MQFIVHFHQAVLENNLAEITAAYESGWNRLTEKFYSKTEWPEAEVIAPLVNDGESPITLNYELSLNLQVSRPTLPYSLPRALLPPCILPHPTRRRRPFPLVREQL